eukprot:Lithocolla_globosa_v1_NODE_3533_length_1645_cov_48.722642.p2 type:complete len:218 gc:universal NODE_3533_length_1645_cov_48.722642:727-1380(+)
MSFRIQQNILRFQVTVDNVEVMEVLERTHNFCRIEACAMLGKPFISLQMEEQLTAVNIVQHKVQFVLCLKRIAQPHKEGVRRVVSQHISFGHDVLNFVTLFDGTFGKDFDCIDLPGLFVLGQHHLSKAALANDLEQEEVVECSSAVIRACSRRFLPICLVHLLNLGSAGVVRKEFLHGSALAKMWNRHDDLDVVVQARASGLNEIRVKIVANETFWR